MRLRADQGITYQRDAGAPLLEVCPILWVTPEKFREPIAYLIDHLTSALDNHTRFVRSSGCPSALSGFVPSPVTTSAKISDAERVIGPVGVDGSLLVASMWRALMTQWPVEYTTGIGRL